MRIDSERRYFKLNEKGRAIFEEYSEARAKAIREKLEAARALLEAEGLPEDADKLGLFPDRRYQIAIPESLHEHLPELLTKPNGYGYCRLKQNRKKGIEIQAAIEQYKVPSTSSYFPTLGLGRGWVVGSHWVSPTLGVYGDEIVLVGVPKRIPWGETYEPDFELLEEMTLVEWAALVERTEAQEEVA